MSWAFWDCWWAAGFHVPMLRIFVSLNAISFSLSWAYMSSHKYQAEACLELPCIHAVAMLLWFCIAVVLSWDSLDTLYKMIALQRDRRPSLSMERALQQADTLTLSLCSTWRQRNHLPRLQKQLLFCWGSSSARQVLSSVKMQCSLPKARTCTKELVKSDNWRKQRVQTQSELDFAAGGKTSQTPSRPFVERLWSVTALSWLQLIALEIRRKLLLSCILQHAAYQGSWEDFQMSSSCRFTPYYSAALPSDFKKLGFSFTALQNTYLFENGKALSDIEKQPCVFTDPAQGSNVVYDM